MNCHSSDHDFTGYSRVENVRQMSRTSEEVGYAQPGSRLHDSEPLMAKAGNLGLYSRVALLPALIVLLPMLATRVAAQGCIGSPNNPCSHMVPHLVPGEFTNTTSLANRWLGAVDYRWFESFRHFVGDVEQSPAQENKNYVHAFNVSATYGFNDRWSATINFPFIYADRSTVYEHDFIHRHTMHAGGLGDIRLATDFWLLNPAQHMDGNLALGIGMKAPTGDDKASDTAFRATGPVIRPVDPSIQPGDGGWGLLLQLQGYQKIFGSLFGYLQGSYLITPEEMNNTQTPLGDNPFIPQSLRYDSIPDQYFGRGGLSYVIWPKGGLTLSLGSRIEGLPVYDAVGGSLGFRRPGYTISIEPGISWTGKKNSFLIYAPVAVYRTRERSASEIALGFPGGDAAFADFSILASFTHRF